MSFKQLKKRKSFKIATNKYVLILAVFIVWMLFFDDNSYLTHRSFDKEIDKLETNNSFYTTKIKEDKKSIKDLQDSLQLEKYGREHYLMKKENEDIYLIEFDTLVKE